MAGTNTGMKFPKVPEIPDTVRDFSFLAREEPKDPEAYKLGDRISDYFPLCKMPGAYFPASFFVALDSLHEAEKRTNQAYIRMLDNHIKFEKLRTEYVIARARARIAATMASVARENRLKFKAAVMGSQPGTSGESTPQPVADGSETRRDRMQGVDVSKLPAGFGKRRGSAVSSSSKRPKTPTEGAPEVNESTPSVTP